MSRPIDILKRPNLSFFALEKAKPGNPVKSMPYVSAHR